MRSMLRFLRPAVAVLTGLTLTLTTGACGDDEPSVESPGAESGSESDPNSEQATTTIQGAEPGGGDSSDEGGGGPGTGAGGGGSEDGY